jgi:hypothetical protein
VILETRNTQETATGSPLPATLAPRRCRDSPGEASTLGTSSLEDKRRPVDKAAARERASRTKYSRRRRHTGRHRTGCNGRSQQATAGAAAVGMKSTTTTLTCTTLQLDMVDDQGWAVLIREFV